MIQKLTFILFAMCCLATHTSFSQQEDLDVQSLIQKVKHSYEDEHMYSLNVTYKLYENSTSTTPKEFFTGKIIRDNNQYYSKINNTEFIQFTNAYVKINHDEKAMLYINEPAKEVESITDFTKYLAHFNEANIALENGMYKCEITAKQVTFLPFTKLVLYVDKNSFRLKKQVVYLAQHSISKDKNGKDVVSNPRLEIMFTNFSNKGINNSQDVFILNNYVNISQNIINPSKKLEAYQLINASKN
ncbi:hypothetical protein [Hyunsoonleella ulvae]|uniref:hypothetical protein n=1 Tax=Hyunsoonleella ulvae TaxID=2799948 RepID=UPI0019398840|nr:hypothetical protein [Hyunsoonleella ulvae]